jgi:hypothetical protein
LVEANGAAVIKHLFDIGSSQPKSNSEIISKVFSTLGLIISSCTKTSMGVLTEKAPLLGEAMTDILNAHRVSELGYNLICEGVKTMTFWLKFSQNME